MKCSERDAQRLLDEGKYKEYLECRGSILNEEKSPENEAMYKRARIMYESYLSLVEFNKRDHSNYYSILGVRRDASQDEIKRAYRRLAFELHPDKSMIKESEDAFKLVLEAYNVLSDKRKRVEYDMSTLQPESGRSAGHVNRWGNSGFFYHAGPRVTRRVRTWYVNPSGDDGVFFDIGNVYSNEMEILRRIYSNMRRRGGLNGYDVSSGYELRRFYLFMLLSLLIIIVAVAKL